MWEDFKAGFTEFTNNPTVIAVATILTTIFGVFVIFSRTSIGKRVLKGLIAKFETLKEENAKFKKEVEKAKTEIEEEKQRLIKEISLFEEDLTKKVTAIYSKYEIFESDLFAVLEEIPNAKVQAKLKELRESKDAKEEEIRLMLGDTYSYVQEKINNGVLAKTKELEEKSKNEIATLKGEVNKLKEDIKNLSNNADVGEKTPTNEEIEVDNHGEEEETTNNQATEE